MPNWKDTLLHFASEVEHATDKAKRDLKKKLGRTDPLIIQPYRGYANQERLFITGRVLEKEGLEKPSEELSKWQNLKAMYHRYESDEMPNAQVEIRLHEKTFKLKTDQEGYYHLDQSLPPLQETADCWHPVHYKLSSHLEFQESKQPYEVSDAIQRPTAKTRQVIISDVDDTIVISKATELLEKLRILMLSNAQTRKPFAGVAAFYQALAAGQSMQEQNMFFYLSSSSWNLYDLFVRFCAINNLPKGCFLLRDVGLDKNKFYRSSHGEHKKGYIEQLFQLYPELNFILIGDSGQHDPEIYQEIARKYSRQISSIYIRDVKPEISNQRDKEVRAIAEDVQQMGVPMLLVGNSYEAAQDAAKRGLIAESKLEAIGREKAHDDSLQQEEEEKGILDFLGVER